MLKLQTKWNLNILPFCWWTLATLSRRCIISGQSNLYLLLLGNYLQRRINGKNSMWDIMKLISVSNLWEQWKTSFASSATKHISLIAPHLTAVFYKYWWHEVLGKRPWCRLELPMGRCGPKVLAPLCSQSSLIYPAHVLPVCGLQRGLHFTELFPRVRLATSQTPDRTGSG